MDYYAGLDVSLKEISICVVDEDGKTIARGVCPADPEGVASWFDNRDLIPRAPIIDPLSPNLWFRLT